MKRKEKIREQIHGLNPIDDALFAVMARDKPFCEEILRVFLEEPNLVVSTNSPQKLFKNLEGRSIQVDLVCDLTSGETVNVEVEKNRLNHVKRVRYNSAILTTNLTDPGKEFEDIQNIIILYITKFDIFGLKKTKYYVDDVIRGFNGVVDTGCLRIFINAKIDDGSDIAKLMKIFVKDNAYDYDLFPVTSRLKYHYKETEEGVNTMYDIIEKLFGEELEQARNEGIKEGEKTGEKRGEKRGEKTGIEKCRSIMRAAFNNKDQVSEEYLSAEFDKILSELELNSSSN